MPEALSNTGFPAATFTSVMSTGLAPVGSIDHPQEISGSCHMTNPPRPARRFQPLTVAVRVAGVAVLLLALSHRAGAAVADKKQPAASQPCKSSDASFSDAAFDTTTDIRALDEYRDAIAQLLKQEKFSELDCLADAARTGKTRFPGGTRKLHYIYLGLSTPRPGHPTEEDWQQHMQLMDRWGQGNPHSVTQPIALAESYIGYAWSARGSSYADGVSESGWKLYGERIAKAKAILDTGADLANKCPEWYIAMHEVAQGQNWGADLDAALIQQAVALDPTYQYAYQVHAAYLLPKWSGADGDASRFAEDSANHVGGDAGDILYFQIGGEIVCRCQEPEFNHFSWPRLQKGFAALEKERGVSLQVVNRFALMATQFQDWVAADAAFKRVGDGWSEDIWGTEAYFKQIRDTAAQVAPMQLRARADKKEAEDNMLTPAGVAYRKQIEPKLTSYEQSCLKESSGKVHKADLFLKIGKDGSVENAETLTPPDVFTTCVMRTLYQTFTRKETPFAAPPQPSYWLVVEVDPAMLAASAK
jgi:hypothetical protein